MRWSLILAVLPLVLCLKGKALEERNTHRIIRRRGCQVRSGLQRVINGPSSVAAISTASSTRSVGAVGALQTYGAGGNKAAVVATSSSAVPQSTSAPSSGFNYGTHKIRGVNLGGWLVIERLTSASLFDNTGNGDIVDEWTFCQYQDRSTAEDALKKHWDTFITRDDFRQIAGAGLNHVRIPVGHWAWDTQGDEPYISGAAAYLDKAIGWAREFGIKVQIDLHGAPGSQNGFDNSGRAGGIFWPGYDSNIQRTVDVIRTIASTYGSAEYTDTVTMLQLLNEPLLSDGQHMQDALKQYYKNAYAAARYPWSTSSSKGQATNFVIVLHDGFMPMSWWDGYDVGDGGSDNLVWLDDHYYQAFGQDYYWISAEEHLRRVCSAKSNYESSPRDYVVGEWSVAVWQCTAAEGNSAMGDVGSCDTNANDWDAYGKFIRAFFDLQIQTFETVGRGQGWIFFNWKTQGIAEWSYQLALQNGWIPSSLEGYQPQYSYSALCS